MSAVEWVADKLAENSDFQVAGNTPEGFLVVSCNGNAKFPVAVLGVRRLVGLSDVEPLFGGDTKPQFVVNVPSTTLWSGSAINRIHAESAAFGTFGDLIRAAIADDVGSYRDDHKMGFFIKAIRQHSNVSSVSYVYDKVFKADRRAGAPVVVAVIDAYNVSAEDVRNARDVLGQFDVVIKSSSYGSITSRAEEAAKSMGAEVLTFRGLMTRLAN
jgi:hypothetical protein